MSLPLRQRGVFNLAHENTKNLSNVSRGTSNAAHCNETLMRTKYAPRRRIEVCSRAMKKNTTDYRILECDGPSSFWSISKLIHEAHKACRETKLATLFTAVSAIVTT